MAETLIASPDQDQGQGQDEQLIRQGAKNQKQLIRVQPEQKPAVVNAPSIAEATAPSIAEATAGTKPAAMPDIAAPATRPTMGETKTRLNGLPQERLDAQAQGKLIPGTYHTDPKTGMQVETPYSYAQQANPFAGVFAHADNIHNPILRTLAKIGAGVGIAGYGVAESQNPELQKIRMAEIAAPGEARELQSKEHLQQAQADEQEAAAKQKESMDGQVIAAREKGFDLTQDPLSGKWQMTLLPANMTSAEQQAKIAEQQAKIAKEQEPRTEVSQGTGQVVQFVTDPNNPGTFVSKPVLDQAGQPTVLDPKKEWEFKDLMGGDGKLHSYAINKNDLKDKHDVGLAKPAGGEDTGKTYDRYAQNLDKDLKPVDAKVADAAQALTLLNNRDKASDALVIPQILKTAVGGQGSGVRITNAEIERIAGGASVWDRLKAKGNQLKESGGTFDETQRATLTKIATYVQQRNEAASYVFAQGRRAMLASDKDDEAIRRIDAHMRQTLSDLNTKGLVPAGRGNLKAGEFLMKDGILVEVVFQNGKPVGKPVEVNP